MACPHRHRPARPSTARLRDRRDNRTAPAQHRHQCRPVGRRDRRLSHRRHHRHHRGAPGREGPGNKPPGRPPGRHLDDLSVTPPSPPVTSRTPPPASTVIHPKVLLDSNRKDVDSLTVPAQEHLPVQPHRSAGTGHQQVAFDGRRPELRRDGRSGKRVRQMTTGRIPAMPRLGIPGPLTGMPAALRAVAIHGNAVITAAGGRASRPPASASAIHVLAAVPFPGPRPVGETIG